MSWFLMAMQKYATFSGRSQRSEYWYYFLFYMIIVIVCAIVDGMLGAGKNNNVGWISTLAVFGMLVPSIAVTVRRLHDIGKSGWWFLVAFVPLVGGIILLLFAVQDSQPDTNEYGPNPKGSKA
jgi:uncharacterized membrane protein YhaH (DUF805 family)